MSAKIFHDWLQTIIGKTFWSLTIIFMLSLGIYFCSEAYQNWNDQPVLTTIKTAGVPVEQVSHCGWHIKFSFNININAVLGYFFFLYMLFARKRRSIKCWWNNPSDKSCWKFRLTFLLSPFAVTAGLGQISNLHFTIYL